MIATEPVETVHLYIVREEEKRPYAVFPLLCALLCIISIAVVTLYSANHPSYEQERLTVPATFLPRRVFKAEVPVVPTGVKTYPATSATGILTFTNGSVIGQSIPAGFTLGGVATDRAVYVPAGSANGYGYATVAAHALASGRQGNLPVLTVNSVIGSSLFVRNLIAFTGGRDAYAITYATAHDWQVAYLHAHGILLNKIRGLHYPCAETRARETANVVVTWQCQFVSYRLPAFYHVFAVRFSGRNLLIDVWFVPHLTLPVGRR